MCSAPVFSYLPPSRLRKVAGEGLFSQAPKPQAISASRFWTIASKKPSVVSHG
jgi:hypothetical protein